MPNSPTRNYLYRRACSDCKCGSAVLHNAPTDVQRAFLRCIDRAGKRTAACLSARSVVRACYRRGWIDSALDLTATGRALAAECP